MATNTSARAFRARTALAAAIAVAALLAGAGANAAAAADVRTGQGFAAHAVPAVMLPVDKKFTKAPKPTISGTKAVGKTLTAKPGTWSPGGAKLSYQWYRSGTKISGATKSTYKVKSADAGKKLTVKVTGKKSGYTTVTKASSAVSIPKGKAFKEYANCTALKKDYPHGVAKSKSVIDMKNGKRGGGITSKTFVSKELYNLNAKSDRDKDGWACEP